MGIRTLTGMLIAALAAISLLALSPAYAVFLPQLLQGAVLTVEIAVLGCLLAVVAGVLAALARMYGPRPLRWLATTYVEIFRGTSALVQLFWLFFVLPQFGVTLPPFLVAVLALGLNVGAYGSEVVRGAILGVARGQWEATTALNMTRPQALRRIILPQAFVAMIPPWGNLFIELLKATSLVSLITLADLTFKAQTLNQSTFKTVPIFTLVLLMYLALSLVAHHRHALAGEPRGTRPRPRERPMIWDWSFAFEILPLLARAAVVTIEATLLGFLIAAVLGLVLASLRIAFPVTAWPISVLVELIRSTPLLIQIFFVYFVFPKWGIVIDAFAAGVIAIGIHYAAYCSEVYRAGFDNIARGQWEASIALNLSPWTTFRDIIIPQAIPPVVPALGNYLVALFKETPLLSAIAVLELMQTAKIIGSQTFRYTEPITLVGAFFLVMSLVSAAGIGALERHLNRRPSR